jgi:hypothetical protein
VGGRFGPFDIVVVVVSLPEGPVIVFVSTTGGRGEEGDCPIVLDDPGTLDSGASGLGVMALVESGNGTGVLTPPLTGRLSVVDGDTSTGVVIVIDPGVVVKRVLNRVGGAMLFSQCVVPLMTE